MQEVVQKDGDKSPPLDAVSLLQGLSRSHLLVQRFSTCNVEPELVGKNRQRLSATSAGMHASANAEKCKNTLEAVAAPNSHAAFKVATI
mmetsp:Transcript_16022/g.49446  ORF Transcript_16022/g.49446 Transcript_16022/m.49446 type:complete len:89 (+) Transcript_16022:131-397(+)